MVGTVLLLLTLGKHLKFDQLVGYHSNKKDSTLDFRDFLIDNLYGIILCTIPTIDTITEVALEYSIIANILLVRIDYP